MPDRTREDDTRLTRRDSLLKLGGLAAGLASAGAWAGEKLWTPSEADAAGTGPAGVDSGLVSCVLAPAMTEGPYYVAGDKVRRNITEGRSGAALLLRLAVVDVSTCKPIKGAAVDIWHADAGGLYSEEAPLGTADQTFLRGIQRTDGNGVATFRTIYPGWYTGRTVHIHVKVISGAARSTRVSSSSRTRSPTGCTSVRRTAGARTATPATRRTRSSATGGGGRCSPSARAGPDTSAGSRWGSAARRSTSIGARE
jgi:intradiol ring-cleaving dioxygenase-like protein